MTRCCVSYALRAVIMLGIQHMTNAASTNYTDAQRLHHELLDNYVPERPVVNNDDVAWVGVSFGLLHITSLDGKSQRLETSGQIGLMWNDPFLSWNTEDYGGINYIEVDARKIWTPLIGLKNSVNEPLNPNWDDEYKVLLTNNGTMYWLLSSSFLSSCDLNMFKFPFDTQLCYLDIGNLLHVTRMVDLRPGQNHVDLSLYVASREFQVLNSTVERLVIGNGFYFGENVSFIRYTLTIKRRPEYYMLNIIIPTMVLAFLSAFTFYVPVDSGEKLSLAITILLSFSVFLLILSDNTPQTSGPLPFLAVYLTVTIVISTASMVAQMVTLNMYHKANPGPVPACLKAVARCLACRKCKSQTHPLEEGKPAPNLDSEFEEGALPKKQDEDKANDEVLRELKKITEFLDEKNAEDELKDGWQKVARSLDNLFFGIFMIVQAVTISLTLSFIFG